ncbi:MAG TPA: hypothetical protein VIG08_00785 [Gemmatimonadales bacterium]|jgi:hypothetical protein
MPNSGTSPQPHLESAPPPSHRRALRSILLIVFAACLGTSPDPLPPDDDLHLLFIGNSLTYTNDLPGMVERLGLALDGKAPVVESITAGDFSLEDHWNQGQAQQRIAAGRWDLVILQQGPSALPESRVNLVEYAGKFAGEARKVGGRPALYMVWPPADRVAEWDDVSESYATAARQVNGVLFPVGEAFRAALRRKSGLVLFAGDGFHPSVAGTYLAAMVIYAQASGRSPIGISSIARIVSLSPGDIEALEGGAAEAIQQFSSP